MTGTGRDECATQVSMQNSWYFRLSLWFSTRRPEVGTYTFDPKEAPSQRKLGPPAFWLPWRVAVAVAPAFGCQVRGRPWSFPVQTAAEHGFKQGLLRTTRSNGSCRDCDICQDAQGQIIRLGNLKLHELLEKQSDANAAPEPNSLAWGPAACIEAGIIKTRTHRTDLQAMVHVTYEATDGEYRHLART